MVVHHARKVVHHLRTRPEEDRRAVAYIASGCVVAILICAWMAWSAYVTPMFPNQNTALSAAAAAGALSTSSTTNIATDIDAAIYVRIPQE